MPEISGKRPRFIFQSGAVLLRPAISRCQTGQYPRIRKLAGSKKIRIFNAFLPDACDYDRNLFDLPDRHGPAGRRGLRRTPLLRSRLRLPLRPPIRTSRAEQNRLGGDGIPGLHPDVRAVGLVRTDVAGRAAGAVLSLPGALPPAGLHLPAADPRQGENAPRHRA